MSRTNIILIVDDEPHSLEALASLLMTDGYQLALARNGYEALEKAHSLIPDLILMDVMMPEMNGFEVCRRMRGDSLLAEVPIILITALDDQESRLHGLEMGADDFITKPFSYIDLRARVRTIIRLNRYRHLLDARAKFERVVELAPLGIMVVEADHMVRLANPALLTLLAVEAESEVIGQPLTRFIAPGQVDNFVACLDNIIENPRQTSQMELTFKPLNRDFFPAKVNIGYFEWEGQPAVQLMIHDITEQKQTEAQLRQAKTEVVRAYDATLEGWSRALELRDEETEGHTQRVTRMTIQLAQAMGMNDEELVHVRRGALLHDIGKIGIPDGILLKPGPLTEEELAIMRKHPVYAYELLLPITYLHPALDIPYCHHEKWDGTGYPRGLKGTEIPLAARIFAVVDVWDALRSDRPYRTAWSAEKVLAHIREQAGQHFDPQVVDIFLEIMESQSAPHHLEKNR